MATQAAALVVMEKINAAIQDMPEVEEIMQLLVGLGVYRHICTRVGYVIHERVPGYPDHGCSQDLNFHFSIKVAL